MLLSSSSRVMRWDFAFGMAFAHFHCLLVRCGLQWVVWRISGIRGGAEGREGLKHPPLQRLALLAHTRTWRGPFAHRGAGWLACVSGACENVRCMCWARASVIALSWRYCLKVR